MIFFESALMNVHEPDWWVN